MSVLSMKELLEAGVHFGHQTRRWNPKMAPYIFTDRNGIHIIDLQKTVGMVDDAYKAISDTVADGGTVLFVSHDDEFVRKTATRIVHFDRKKLIPFEGTLQEMKNAKTRDTSSEDLRIAVSTLEMRMAALSARMAAPKKGDRPDQLQAEYMEMAVKLRELKRKGN